jgi:hypothetical protein
MPKKERFILTIIVVAASLAPAADALAGTGTNHNETLLVDA